MNIPQLLKTSKDNLWWALEKLRCTLVTLQSWLDNVLPPAIFMAYLFFAILILLATAGAGLATFETSLHIEGQHLTRIKGFAWEANWGPNHIVLIPTGLFWCAFVLSAIRRQVETLASAKMVVNSTFTPATPETIREEWSKWRLGPISFGTILFLAFLASWAEWWLGSAGPIFGLVSSEPERYRGWTNGATLNQNISPVLNAILSFAAFCAQGFVVTYVCYTTGMLLAFGNWLYHCATAEDHKLVPNVTRNDVRRGFEQFEPLMFALLYFGMSVIIIVFAIRIQIVYNLSNSPQQSVYEFFLIDVVQGFADNATALFRGDPQLFAVGLAPVYGTIITCAAMAAMLAVVMLFPTMILSLLARQCRETMLGQCTETPRCAWCVATNANTHGCKQRLESMEFWPMKYPRPIELLAYVVFAGFCFMFYRFMAVLIGILVIRLVLGVCKVLFRSIGGPTQNAISPKPSGGIEMKAATKKTAKETKASKAKVD